MNLMLGNALRIPRPDKKDKLPYWCNYLNKRYWEMMREYRIDTRKRKKNSPR